MIRKDKLELNYEKPLYVTLRNFLFILWRLRAPFRQRVSLLEFSLAKLADPKNQWGMLVTKTGMQAWRPSFSRPRVSMQERVVWPVRLPIYD